MIVRGRARARRARDRGGAAADARRPKPALRTFQRPRGLQLPPKGPPPSDIDILTGDILQRIDTANRHSVASRADVGRLLLEVRQQLPHGGWKPYLAARVPFNVRSADRAIALYHFSKAHLALFDKLGPLDISKAYLLISISPAEITAIVSQAHYVRSAKATLTPAQMTFKQLVEVIDHEPEVDLATQMRKSYKRQIRGLVRLYNAMIKARIHIVADDFEHLHDLLLDAAGRFAKAYRLAS